MKTPHPNTIPDLTPAEVAKRLIQRDLDGLPAEAKWMVQSAQDVAARILRDGVCSASYLNDVITHALSIQTRLTRIETLKDVLPRS